jgi:cyclic pyranopterin phosphate synthase
MSGLTHIGPDGRPRMVDVSGKASTAREAVAAGLVRMAPQTRDAALAAGPKGDVRRVAEIAGIMGAKKTAELIPLCHPVALSAVELSVEAVDEGLAVLARAKTEGPTGVEMEALTAASIACLTIYDMLKAVDKAMTFEVRLLEKTGGKSGDWRAP